MISIDLSIGYQNIEGIHDKNFNCKLQLIEKKLIHDIENLSETWGICNHSKDLLGYKCIPVNSLKKKYQKGKSIWGIAGILQKLPLPICKRM